MKAINFILYGNFFIALCAYVQTVQTCYFLGINTAFSEILPIFAALATFFLYNIHKPITYFLKKQLIDNQRFLKTKSYSTPLSILTILAGILCFYIFFKIKVATQLSLIIAAVLSLAYVLPILGGKRLRDLPFVKIFTIAFVWAFVTIILPVREYEVKTDARIVLMFFEKILFIFSLTIPFDIRDMDWDAKTNVKTIPLSIGARNAKYLSILFLLNCIGIVIVLNRQGFYSLIDMTALLFSYLVSIVVIGFTQKNRNDYFFYGLTDGMMVLQSLLIFGFNMLII